MEGKCAMMWSGIFYFYGRSTVAVLRGMQKAKNYQAFLEMFLHLPMNKDVHWNHEKLLQKTLLQIAFRT